MGGVSGLGLVLGWFFDLGFESGLVVLITPYSMYILQVNLGEARDLPLFKVKLN